MAARHTDDELRAAGLRTEVREANDRASRLIDRAAKVLEPLEIDRRDLNWLLERRLKRGHP